MHEHAVILSRAELEAMISDLVLKYHAARALLFGSYARGDATAASDIDLVVYGVPLPKSSMSAPANLWTSTRSVSSGSALRFMIP